MNENFIDSSKTYAAKKYMTLKKMWCEKIYCICFSANIENISERTIGGLRT